MCSQGVCSRSRWRSPRPSSTQAGCATSQRTTEATGGGLASTPASLLGHRQHLQHLRHQLRRQCCPPVLLLLLRSCARHLAAGAWLSAPGCCGTGVDHLRYYHPHACTDECTLHVPPHVAPNPDLPLSATAPSEPDGTYHGCAVLHLDQSCRVRSGSVVHNSASLTHSTPVSVPPLWCRCGQPVQR
jgi:hypothetical protein